MSTNLTNEERRRLNTKRIDIEVTPFEAEFIKQMRKYTHGRITAVLLDGIPVRIEFNITQMIFGDDDDIVDKVKKVI